MASITASTLTPAADGTVAAKGSSASSSPVLGLPLIGMRGGRATCSSSSPTQAKRASPETCVGLAGFMGRVVQRARRLVEERLSTEGTGLRLSLGLSNNLLG
ncbi:uncharacterized protein A4U43_C10F18880 [Asparagus officinalis]|uniref:PSII 6.1 kDa protein n=1 Tax=Asparagus officinalis TaxID=4686 RepID=A0A5P1E3U7_ASPOF|nr:uncharacterized protein A4U43_C10F18880 [Asparagus officinalis]